MDYSTMGVILITGGAGFIGVNLARQLLAGPHRLRILDNFSSGRPQDLKGLPVDLLEGDIRHPSDVARAMDGVQVVIHLAAHTGVVESVINPQDNMAVNVMGTLNLLQAAVERKVQRFIFASTGGAIGGNVIPPVHEDMPPRPASPYGASKLAGEGYCSAFWGSYGLPTISLRFSNVYGPYSYRKGSVIAKFFRQIMGEEELTIYGDGEQTRDFLYVSDLCKAMVTVLTADLPLGQAIQLGSGKETSINHLVSVMQTVVGEENFPGWKYAPAHPGEVQRNYVALDRAKKYLHFSPTMDFHDGLNQTWEWFKNQKRF